MAASRYRSVIMLRTPLWKLRRWLPAVMLSGLGSTVLAVQPPAKELPAPMPAGMPPMPAAGMPPVVAPPVEKEKTYSQTFDKASWDVAFGWLEKQTGLKLITSVRPISSATMRIENKTLGEVLDLFNEVLAAENFILIRREQSFTIFATDKKIPKDFIRRVTVPELAKLGRTEFVGVMVPLKSLIATEMVPQVRKLISEFGDVYPLGSSSLFIEDKVGTIKTIIANLKELDEGGGASGDSLTHICKFQRAGKVAETLGKLLKDPTTNVDTTVVPPGGVPGQPGMPSGFPQPQFDPRGRGGNPAAGPDPRFRTVQLAVLDDTNTIIVTAPADKIAVAQKLLKEIDVGVPGQKERPVGGLPSVVLYNVPSGTADAQAANLKNIFKSSPSVTITSLTAQNQVMVYAGPADHFEIATILKGADSAKSNTKVELVTLNVLDITKTAETLTKALGSTGLFVEAQSGGILLRGSEDQIQSAKEFIKALGENPGVGGAVGGNNMRVISIDRGSPSLMAEGLAELLRKLGTKNPVELNIPGAPAKPATPAPLPVPNPVVPTPGGEKKSMLPTPGLIRSQYVAAQVPGDAPAPMPKADDKSGKPIVITVAGDKIILTSDDPAALDMAQSVLRLFLDGKGKEIYEVIRLKHISAEEAAKTITEVFNGPQQQSGGAGGRGGGFNPFAAFGIPGLGGAPVADPSKDRIRVVAEKTSNSIIVIKASPADLYTMRKLLQNAIDYDGPPEGGVAKTYTIKLDYARATDVAATLETIFRSLINPGRGQQAGIPGFPFGFPGAQQQPQQQATLSVSADETSNRVIVYCNDGTYQEVSKLCKELDIATKSSGDIVRVVPVQGLSPTQVQEAIDALTGKLPPAGSTANRNTGSFGGGGFPGSFGGGFPGGGSFGGGFPGGGRGSFGGGGGRGGQGGGRGGGRPQRSDRDAADGGRDFFEQPGMDAPSAPINTIYDPNSDGEPQSRSNNDNNLLRASYQEPAIPQPPVGGAPMPKQPGATQAAVPPQTTQPAPSGDVVVTPFEQLGVVILRGRTQADIDQVLEFIKQLQATIKDAEIELVFVPLKEGDATEIVYLMNQIYNRVQIGPGTSGTIQPAQQQRGGFGGFGGFFGGGGQQQQQTTTAGGQLVLFPLPRFNQILMAAPKSRVADVTKLIQSLDRKNGEQGQPVAYKLTRSSASVVTQQLQTFFAQRYPGEALAQNQIRVFAGASNNTVFVQAGPADQKDIAAIIKDLDTGESAAVSQVKIIKLNNAFADEVSQILQSALISSVINPNTTANAGTAGAGTGAGAGTVQGGFGPVQAGGGQAFGQQAGGGGFGAQGGFGQQQNRAGGAGGLGGGATGTLTGGGISTKTTTLRFVSGKDGRAVESGFLEDVHVYADARINAVVITAPEKTMKLLEELIKELDTVSAAKSFVNVFQLKNNDATAVATLIRTLFTGATTTGAGAAGGFGAQGGFGQQAGATQNANRPLLSLSGDPGAGAGLLDLRLAPDARTNTLTVAGSRNDLDTINAIIARLEDADAPKLLPSVYKLRHAAAADVAQAVTTFLNNQATLINGQFATTATFQTLQRNVVVVAEPVTNQLLISASTQFSGEIQALIQRLDAPPPQVLVQVMIVEVQLNNREELGVELGLQSPVLFARSTVGTSPGTPGYLFNSTAALANATLANQSLVGYQGIGNLGVGRASANGVGGFVFSAASDTVSVLVRALKQQGKTEILSRPQLLLTDNQQGFFQVGQRFPLLDATVVTNAAAQQSIRYEELGIVLRVTPRIDPDGSVLMRVEPQISAANPTLVNLGGGALATSIDVQSLQTTVRAMDGETCILGGLIRKADSKQENKIPLLGDLPWIGAAFRYRTQDLSRRELIFIVTPHLIRTEADMARLLTDESRKMSWNYDDVMNIHGHGGAQLSGRPQQSSWNGMMAAPFYGSPATPGAVIDPTMNGGSGIIGSPILGQPQMIPQGQPIPGAIPTQMPGGTPSVSPGLPGAYGTPIMGNVQPSRGTFANPNVPPQPLPPITAVGNNGFPIVAPNGGPTVFTPPPSQTPTPAAPIQVAAPTPTTKEGTPWGPFKR